MMHPGIKDKLNYTIGTLSTSTIDMFTYYPFNMSFNISSKDVTFSFHTPFTMCQWNEVLIHINKK